MKKTSNGRRLFDREYKLSAIQRVEQGEKQVAVARELKIRVELLAKWRRQFRSGGESALMETGRRGISRSGRMPADRMAELERLIGRQQASIDFLEQALRQVEELRRKKKDSGATASSE